MCSVQKLFREFKSILCSIESPFPPYWWSPLCWATPVTPQPRTPPLLKSQSNLHWLSVAEPRCRPQPGSGRGRGDTRILTVHRRCAARTPEAVLRGVSWRKQVSALLRSRANSALSLANSSGFLTKTRTFAPTACLWVRPMESSPQSTQSAGPVRFWYFAQ